MTDPKPEELKRKFKEPPPHKPGWVGLFDLSPEDEKVLDKVWDRIAREGWGDCLPSTFEERDPEAA